MADVVSAETTPCAGSFSAPQLHKASPEPLFHTSPRMRPGAMAKHMYLQHLAFAFIGGGLLTYLCITFLGSTGILIARHTPTPCIDVLLALTWLLQTQ